MIQEPVTIKYGGIQMNKKDSLSKKLGMYLKHLRKESGLKLDEVSEKSDLSVSYVSRIENGLINAPSLYTIPNLKAIIISLHIFINPFISLQYIK